MTTVDVHSTTRALACLTLGESLDDAALVRLLAQERGGEDSSLVPAALALVKRRNPNDTSLTQCFNCTSNRIWACFGMRNQIGAGPDGVHRDLDINCKKCGSTMTYII